MNSDALQVCTGNNDIRLANSHQFEMRSRARSGETLTLDSAEYMTRSIAIIKLDSSVPVISMVHRFGLDRNPVFGA